MMTDALKRDGKRELALERVHIETVEDVDSEDDSLPQRERLQEVHWSAHLRDDLRKYRGTSIGVDDVHYTVYAFIEGV